MQMKLVYNNHTVPVGENAKASFVGKGATLLFRETPHDEVAQTAISLLAIGGTVGSELSWNEFKTEWAYIDNKNLPHVKRLVGYATKKPSNRPTVTLKIEINGSVCWRCHIGLKVTLYEDDPEDPLDDHKDGIIVFDRPGVKMVKGIITGDSNIMAKVFEYKILYGNP